MSQLAPWKTNQTALFIAATALSTVAGATSATLVALAVAGDAPREEPTVHCTCTVPKPAEPRCETVAEVSAPTVAKPDETPTSKRLSAPFARALGSDPSESDSRSGDVSVNGALDKGSIRGTVAKNIGEVRHCYNEGLARQGDLEGRVDVQFTIGPDGEVPMAVVRSSTLDDEAVAQCIAQSIRRWSFEAPEGGGNVVVTYPFILSPE